MNLRDSIRSAWEVADLPGAAIAIVKDGEVTVTNLGVRDVDTGEPVTDQTVFDVASLTKPMVAYAVLQMVDEGAIGLDDELSKFTAPLVPDDPRSSLVTLRHVLNHTSGFPNLKGSDPIRIYFEPGSRYSYSSIGFMYLQRAIEAIINDSLESIMHRLVFGPLGMSSSSLVWHDRFAVNVAIPHESGKRLEKHLPSLGNASYSLQTTAADYGRFIAAAMQGTRLEAETSREWLRPVMNVPMDSAIQLEAASSELDSGIAWGLGWGLEHQQGTFFQWGKMDGVRSFVMGCPEQNTGVAMLTNGNTGLRLMRDVANVVLPFEHPAVRWLAACVTE
ncbi:N/A [soil metagenome]